MSEANILGLLENARDLARSNAMLRLAEHLDDAILVAASEFHAERAENWDRLSHDRGDPETFRGAASRGLH